MKVKKRRLTAKKTAILITGSLWEFLEKLPKKERHKRLDDFHNSVKSKLATTRRSSSHSDTDHKGSGHLPAVPVRYAARSGR